MPAAGAEMAARLAGNPIQTNPCHDITLSASNQPGVGNSTDPEDGDGDGNTPELGSITRR